MVAKVKESKIVIQYYLILRVQSTIREWRFSPKWGDGVLSYHNRFCVPDMGVLRKHIPAEAHNSKFSILPGATKMYRDMWKSICGMV